MADAFDLEPIENLVRGLLRPLTSAVQSPANATSLLVDLGYLPPAAAPALGDLAPSMSAIIDGLADLQAALEANDDSALAAAVSTLLTNLARFFAAIATAVDSINDAYSGTTFATAANLAAELPQRLVDYVIVKFLEDDHPVLHASLQLIGLITNEDVDDAPTQFHTPHRSRVVHWDLFQTAFADPRAALNSALWNGSSLRYVPILSVLGQLGVALGLPAGYTSPKYGLLTALNDGTDLTSRNDYDRLLALDFPLYRDSNASVALQIYPIVNATTGDVEGIGIGIGLGITIEIPLGDTYEMKVSASVDAANAFGVRVRRGAPITFVSSLLGPNPGAVAAGIQFGASVGVEPVATALPQPLLQIGFGASRFEVGAGALKLGIERTNRERFFIEGDLRRGLILIAPGGADSFLAKILPPEGIKATFDLTVGFATDTGLYFSGSGGLEIQLPLHLALGPIELTALDIAIKFGAQGIPIELGASIKAELGPLVAVVESMGVKALVSFPPGGGNVGPAQMTFGFKPPKGVGFSIDAGAVKGGGYLYLDFDKGEYAGALELVIANFINLKAIGLITTKMPDGQPGFSLLIIITAEFGTGFQLGYGFKLIGVGGLLGLNRAVLLEPLAYGVRTGAVSGIMFPRNVVQNAPRIISDLRTIFPPVRDKFLIGPMAKIGWMTPTLISLSLGVIIEIPGNIAIVGVLALILPDPDAPVLTLQVAFMGGIEFDKKRIFFFAAIFDSRLLFITIEGELGVLAAFGNDATFILSAGGFHPNFPVPPLPFPAPRRIALKILDESWGRIRAETYFALTPNTVQFGCRAELFFGFSGFSVEGHFAFDALMQFVPLYFIIELSAAVALKVGGAGLFNIDLQLALEGPTPWHARGRASIRILCWDVEKQFDETWGEAVEAQLDPIAVLTLLATELGKLENWRALLAPSTSLLVSLRKLPEDPNVLVLHPLGSLQVTQRAVPLDVTIAKVGEQRPSDAKRFALTARAGGFAKTGDAREQFAAAQFFMLSDAEKLSRPPYETMNGGLTLSVQGRDLASSRAVRRIVRYERVIVDANYKRLAERFVAFIGSLFVHFLGGNAVALSPLSTATQKKTKPEAASIKITGDHYAVAFTKNNKAVANDAAAFPSYSEANAFLQAQLAADPNGAAGMQAVAAHELNAA